jgi:spermidine/putrescine transport system permease protein
MADRDMAATASPTSSGRAARLRRTVLVGYAALFFGVLYLPMLLLAFLSVNDTDTMSASFRGFTGRWYETVAASSVVLGAIRNSLLVGVLSSAIATTLAVMLGLGFREDIPFKGLLLKLVLVPVLVPGIVSGVIYLIYFGYLGVPPGLFTTVLPAHVTWVLPFAFLTIFPRIQGFDRSLEEAAMDLGATRAVVFRRVVLPIIRPGIVATAMFGFTLSFDEFIRSFMIVGRERTVPVHLWELLSDQMAPFLPAVGVVVTLISIAVSFLGFATTAWVERSRSVAPTA